MKTLTTQSELRETRHEAGVSFLCGDCAQSKPVQTNGGTGYGYYKNSDKPVCYDCCAKRDELDMKETGRACLYLTNYHGTWIVTNWPGTLRISATVRKGRHNIARTRYDAWFQFGGKRWHGVTIGENTQICRCKALRGS